MKVAKIFFLVLLSVCMFDEIQSQSQKKTKTKKVLSYKLNELMPTVYITFEKYETFVYERTRESFDMILLRVHNNSKGTVSFSSYDGSLSPSGKTTLHYRAENVPISSNQSSRNNEKVSQGVPDSDVFNELKVKSGKSFLFVVFKDDLEKGKRIKVQFSYPWEDSFSAFLGEEPEHIVYFYASDM